MEYIALLALNSIDILTGIIAAKLNGEKFAAAKQKTACCESALNG